MHSSSILLSKISLNYSKNSHWWSMRYTLCKKGKKRNFHSLLCLLPRSRNLNLPSAIVGLFSLASATLYWHIFLTKFTLTCQSINKSKYKTHPRYIAIIERSWNRSDVIQMSLSNWWNVDFKANRSHSTLKN